MKPDQERVRSVLIDSIVIMCQKGLNYNCELKLQGVIGITVDYNESFVVHINQTIEAATNSNISATNSPPYTIKQESQQWTAGTVDGYQQQSSIKREPINPGGSVANRAVKVEPFQGGRFVPNQDQAAQFSSQTPKGLQMALVPVNKNQPRMTRPPSQGMAPGMTRGMVRPRGRGGPRAVRPQQQCLNMKQEADFGPSTSFQPQNMGQQAMRGTRPPAPKQRRAPKKNPNLQYMAQDEFMEECYGDEEEDYIQPQMDFTSTKRPRGGGQSRGAAAKRARGSGQGQVSRGSDKSFKLVSRFICDISGCNASFTMKCNLRRHQKSKHPEFNFDDDDDGGDVYGNESLDFAGFEGDGGEYY